MAGAKEWGPWCLLVTAAAIAFPLARAHSEAPAGSSPAAVAFNNVNVVDVRSGHILANRRVVILYIIAGPCVLHRSYTGGDKKMSMWVTLAVAAQVSVAAAPDRVCVDPRTGHPNVDFFLTNKADKAVVISEIRGLVFGRDGDVIERRLIWQD